MKENGVQIPHQYETKPQVQKCVLKILPQKLTHRINLIVQGCGIVAAPVHAHSRAPPHAKARAPSPHSMTRWTEGEGKGGVTGLSSRAEGRVRVRGEYRFVESKALLSQRLNARGGMGVWVGFFGIG